MKTILLEELKTQAGTDRIVPIHPEIKPLITKKIQFRKRISFQRLQQISS